MPTVRPYSASDSKLTYVLALQLTKLRRLETQKMECRKYMSQKMPFLSLFSKKWNNSNITEHMYVLLKIFND